MLAFYVSLRVNGRVCVCVRAPENPCVRSLFCFGSNETPEGKLIVGQATPSAIDIPSKRRYLFRTEGEEAIDSAVEIPLLDLREGRD